MPEPIPQHDTPTEGGEGEKKGGVLHKLFEKHGNLWLIGIGAATLIFLYVRSRSNSAAAQAAQAGSMPTGYDTSGTAGLSGSQADSNYQQLQATENTNTALLQQLLTALGTTPPPPGGTPPPTNNPLKAWWSGSALPTGTQIKWGTQGQSFYQTPGSNVWNPLAGPQFSSEFLGNNGIFDYIIAGQHGEYFLQQQQTIGGQKVLSPQMVLVAPHA